MILGNRRLTVSANIGSSLADFGIRDSPNHISTSVLEKSTYAYHSPNFAHGPPS